MSLKVFRDRFAFDRQDLSAEEMIVARKILSDLDRYIAEFTPSNSRELIKAARDLYQDDECEIDDDAEFSPNDAGCWVAAWVFVSNEELKVQREARRKNKGKNRKDHC